MNRILVMSITSAFLFSVSLFADDERVIGQRIHSHLLLNDLASAKEEALNGLAQFPHSKSLQLANIEVLAKEGSEKQMVLYWKEYIKAFPEESQNRDLLETMAWGIIEKATRSSCPITRVIAMLGAFFSQDIKGVNILQKNMHDPNTILRSAAVELASHLRDDKLRDEVQVLFREEKMWMVRLLTIRAAGQMKITAMKPDLEEILSNERSTAEEKVAAIESLVAITESADPKEVRRLSQNGRAGLRLLACQLVIYFGDQNLLSDILPLLNDTNSGVRAAAVQTVGLIHPTGKSGEAIIEKIYPLLNDPEPNVAISAAWVASLYQPDVGIKHLEEWISDEIQDRRTFAASAIAAVPKINKEKLLSILEKSQDPYVRINIALGMIPQRCETGKACEVLSQALIEQQERWNWSKKGIFKILLPVRGRTNDDLTSSPEGDNQMVRLEILNMLAMLNDPRAPEAIKHFLQDRNWGLSGIAAAVLLSEGDEPALDLVRGLLKDPDPRIRIQAALVLALWGRDEQAISVLEEGYSRESRETKGRIFEALGKVGALSTIPFLVDGLLESQQTLRVSAATALIQCLNH